MSARSPSYPRLMRFKIFGELMYSTSSRVAWGRALSTCRTSDTDPAKHSSSRTLAVHVTFRDIFISNYFKFLRSKINIAPQIAMPA